MADSVRLVLYGMRGGMLYQVHHTVTGVCDHYIMDRKWVWSRKTGINWGLRP